MIFHKCYRSRGWGINFVKKIVDYYKKDRGIVVESPNNATKKICDKLGLEYYYI